MEWSGYQQCPEGSNWTEPVIVDLGDLDNMV